MKKINVAIDGTSGVGKSTLAKLIANEFNLIFVNTGQMYRAIAYWFLSHNHLDDDYINQNLENEIKDLKPLENEKIILNGKEVSNLLWSDEISKSASWIAKNKKVRFFCVALQSKIAKKKNVVMEGRDIGSVVIPNAEIKFFLEASPETRAIRRIKQLKEKMISFDENEILGNIRKRDFEDSTREIDPLKKTEDAFVIDTSNISLEDVKEIMFNKIRKILVNE